MSFAVGWTGAQPVGCRHWIVGDPLPLVDEFDTLLGQCLLAVNGEARALRVAA